MKDEKTFLNNLPSFADTPEESDTPQPALQLPVVETTATVSATDENETVPGSVGSERVVPTSVAETASAPSKSSPVTPSDQEIEAALKARREAHSAPKHRRKKCNGCLSSAIWVSVIGIVSIFLAVTIIFAFSEILGVAKDKDVVVTISQGDTVDEIAQKLKDVEAINYPIIFRLYAKLKGADSKFQYGTYLFNSSIGVDGIVEKLQSPGKDQFEIAKIRIPEGATTDEIIQLLEDAGVTTKAKFRAAMKDKEFDHYAFTESIPEGTVYYKFEGYLFPDTYQFAKDSSGETALKILLNNMNKKLPQEYYDRAAKMGYTLHEIITLASIIEKEAGGFEAEMHNVAAVFYNRLAWTDQPNLLGSTPTASYPYGNGKYDTNKHPGLPPGPICNPSLAAIKAALYPTENFEYDYFVTDSAMNFYYNKTYQQHQSTIAELKRKGLWLG